MEQRIHRSSLINHERLRKITERHKLCEELFVEVRKEAQRIIRQDLNHYRLLLIQLIVSGIIRMFE